LLTKKRPNLDWLDLPFVRSDLSRWAQEGLLFGRVMRGFGWTPIDLANELGWRYRSDVDRDREVRTIFRRLARAEREIRRRGARTCSCGCGREIPPSRTARAKHVDDTCKNRAYRARQRARRLASAE
jgi:hypothetical protein